MMNISLSQTASALGQAKLSLRADPEITDHSMKSTLLSPFLLPFSLFLGRTSPRFLTPTLLHPHGIFLQLPLPHSADRRVRMQYQ